MDHSLVIGEDTDDEGIEGVETVEPAFGIKAKWWMRKIKKRLRYSGIRYRSFICYYNAFIRGNKESCA